MGYKFNEIEEGSYLVLHISSKDKSMEMSATLKKRASDNVGLITIEYEGTRRLNFDNVTIDMECSLSEGMPVIWRNVKITYYQNNYILQVFGEGNRYNRRNCFRVSVGVTARLHALGKGTQQIVVKDVSLSGFSITDRKKELNLSTGDQIRVTFEDIGHRLDLEGRVTRVEQREDMTIYGLKLCNLCKDLSSYVNVKQRRNKK